MVHAMHTQTRRPKHGSCLPTLSSMHGIVTRCSRSEQVKASNAKLQAQIAVKAAAAEKLLLEAEWSKKVWTFAWDQRMQTPQTK